MMGRPDLFVIGRLLEALTTAPGPLRRTPLQQRAGLNYTVFQRYLDYLFQLGLIAPTTASPEFLEITPKGAEAYRFLSEGLSRIFPVTNVSSPTPGQGRTRTQLA
jgi:predicted transcriptional regulator